MIGGIHMGFPGSSFDTAFSGAFSLFTLVFIVILGVFVVVFVKGIMQWNKNNHSPVLTVDAKIVAKRNDIHHHRNVNSDTNRSFSTSTSTTYYATFEVESGDRMELSIPANEFGYLVEGDNGKLTFQGTRFLKYDRYR